MEAEEREEEMNDDLCANGCGRPATDESMAGVTANGDVIAELLCAKCWEKVAWPDLPLTGAFEGPTDSWRQVKWMEPYREQ